MDLHVKFSGLCLFVTPSTGDLVHVLMPATPVTVPGSGIQVQPHQPELEVGGQAECTNLAGYYVNLQGVGGNGHLVDLPAPVLNAGMLSDNVIDRDQWGPDARPSVTTRITLPKATAIHCGQTAEYVPVLFKRDHTLEFLSPQCLTNELTWVIEGIQAGFFNCWQRWRLRTAGACVSRTLPTPVAQNGKISLHFHHHAPGSGNLRKGQEALHFQAYHTLFASPPDTLVRPVLNETPHGAVLGATPYNCMLGGSPGG